MTSSELTKSIQQSLHTIRNHLSPVTTYFGLLNHQNVSDGDREKLVQSAEDNLKLVVKEIENLGVFLKNTEKE